MQFIFLIVCPDQVGIVARFTDVLYKAQANIISLEQHVENNSWFFMRVEATFAGSQSEQRQLLSKTKALATKLDAKVQVYDAHEKQKIAILATSEAACPRELLIQEQAGLLAGEIVCLIANKPDLTSLADVYEKPFHVVTTDKGMLQAENEMEILIKRSKPDLVVLARYMKVLSDEFVRPYESRIINIHHGFLPAFKGNKPYHQAWERGVKCIGATAHFVTAELDDGPIIAQEVIPVSHQHSVNDMILAGREIEKRVLLQAVQAYLAHKIIVHHRRTIIFH